MACPIPTLGDFADVGPEIAETIGGIGGGIGGAAAAGTLASYSIGAIPAATAGFVAGEGLGSAAAREAYIGILDFFRGNRRQPGPAWKGWVTSLPLRQLMLRLVQSYQDL